MRLRSTTASTGTDGNVLPIQSHQSKRLFVGGNGGELKISITTATLTESRIRLTPEGYNHLQHTLASPTGLTFPARRFSMVSKMVGKGDQNCDCSAWSGPVPRRIYFFQILNIAYKGKISKNSFNFQKFDMHKIQVFRNGDSVPLAEGIESTNLLLLMSLNDINRPKAISFNNWAYGQGYMIACFDLTRDASASASSYGGPKETGTVRIKIDNFIPLDEAITVFWLIEDDAVLRIDSSRNPTWVS